MISPQRERLPKKNLKLANILGQEMQLTSLKLLKEERARSLIRIPASADFMSYKSRKIIEDRVISTDGSFIDQRSPDFDRYYPNGKNTKTKEQGIYDKDYTSFRLSWQYVNKRA